ncbi:MAG: helix-turn-helix transcriptional regulator [Treponema sp.]|jgi:transcriptional regulator with XRE-family HTH domain|nr:helix-turn-helix transcriptional regulator [Treponema sp.]
MRKKFDESNDLRRTLSLNIKKQRKILGLTQEKLAEATDLSSQTINDIEGCRMWVSDKTILKLAKILHTDAYQLFKPITAVRTPIPENANTDKFIFEIESKIIKFVKQQFEEAKDALNDSGSAESVQ